MKESAIGILINHQEQGLIWDKIQAGKRLLPADALYLYEEAPLGLTAAMANWVREQRHEDKTYFNRNIHIEPTNVCIYDCKFCSYSRLIKERNQGWEYTKDQMMDILRTQKINQLRKYISLGECCHNTIWIFISIYLKVSNWSTHISISNH